MRTMSSTTGPHPRALLLLLFSALLFAAGISATPTTAHFRQGTIQIISRQDTAAAVDAAAVGTNAPGTPLNVALACAQYSRIANLSAIATNSTFRATFLDVSPVGTLFNEAMLTQAMNDLPRLTMDPQLNQACGNLTAVANAEVATNFTNGIIGQFTFTGSHTSVTTGPIIAIITVAAVLIICGPISAL